LFDLKIYLYPNENLQDPGLIVVPAGSKVARGRENNLLIIYFTLSGQTAITPDRLHSWMEQKAALFYKNPGTVTAGMRELIEAVNADLFERNSRPDHQAGQVVIHLQVAVIKRDMLYLATCGAGQSFFVGSESLFQQNSMEETQRGLGLTQAVSVRFSQSQIGPNDVLVLATNPPTAWTTDLLAGGQALSIEAFSRRLFATPGPIGQGVFIRFSEGNGKASLLPIGTIAHAAEESTPVMRPTEGPATVLKRVLAETDDRGLPSTHRQEPPEQTKPVESVSDPNQEPRREDWKNHPESQLSKEEAQPDSEKEDTDSNPVVGPILQTDQIKSAVNKALKGSAQASNKASHWFAENFPKVMPGDPKESMGWPKGLLIAIAVIIPVIIVAIAMTLYLRNGATGRASDMVTIAQQLVQRAESQTEDPAAQLESLNESMDWLDKADSYGKTDASIALRNQVQSGIDQIENVIRVDMTQATEILLPNINITQIVANDQDLYSLDSVSGKVLRFTLSGSTYVQDTSFDCGPNPSNPASSIGALVDMVSIPLSNSYNATILAVDTAGNLEYCVPGETGYVAHLATPDMGWNTIQSITYSDSNLYVLDGKGNAVYRFQSSGTDYAEKPTLFFDEEIPPLADALDIEEIGYELYILRGNGQMIKCTYSPIKDMKSTECLTPAPFLDARSGATVTVNSFPEAQFIQMRMTDAPDSSLYLLDAKSDTVYHFSYARSLQRILHPRMDDGSDSTKMVPTAFAVSPSRLLFIAYSNQIYYGQIP
jgi:hypothetical protein